MSTRAKVWQQAGKLNFLMEPWHNNMAKEDIEEAFLQTRFARGDATLACV